MRIIYLDIDSLRHLRQYGYRTVSFSSFADRHQAFWFCGGWAEMHNPTLKQGEEDADEINGGGEGRLVGATH